MKWNGLGLTQTTREWQSIILWPKCPIKKTVEWTEWNEKNFAPLLENIVSVFIFFWSHLLTSTVVSRYCLRPETWLNLTLAKHNTRSLPPTITGVVNNFPAQLFTCTDVFPPLSIVPPSSGWCLSHVLRRYCWLSFGNKLSRQSSIIGMHQTYWTPK